MFQAVGIGVLEGRGASYLRHISVLSFKVVGAKVVTNARSPGARCYGFVTMSTAEEATKCINHLHKTELHGKMISVEKVRVCSLPVQLPFEEIIR